MNLIRNGLTPIILAVVTLLPMWSPSKAADLQPLGWVELSSQTDAEAVAEIVDHAFVRDGNRLLVLASLEQQTTLSNYRIAFEPVLASGELDDLHVVYSMGHPRAFEPVDLRAFGEPVDLGSGMRLLSLSRASAASVSETGQMRARPLSDLSIRIHYVHPQVVTPLDDVYPTDSLASRISQDSLKARVERLVAFQTRYAYTDSCLAARDWMVQRFRDWGYTDVSTQRLTGTQFYNVVAVKLGTVEPEHVIVIGGHYDSWTNGTQSPGPWQYAPGADDDGSGTAVTMEVARILADVPLRKTVIFIPFAAEELGLLGSDYAAEQFADDQTKLEVMYNFDMVGFTNDAYWDLDLSSGDNSAYRDFSIATTSRVTGLIPISAGMGGSSDHASFDQEGFNVVNHIETDFNSLGWHTNLDIPSRMNFPYLAEVARMAAVSLAIVADAAYPVAVDTLQDVGDGQSLRMAWSDCSSDCSYVVKWGTEPSVYTDSAQVPTGECEYSIVGLDEGTEYFTLAIGESPNGYRAMYGVEGSGTPRIFPLTPQNLAGEATASQLRLTLTWNANAELDLSHYNVYRSIGGVGAGMLVATDLNTTSYVDQDLIAHVGYQYSVTAVDFDGHESGQVSTDLLYPATFDGGIVIADGFVQDHNYDPDQAWQEAWLDSILSGAGFAVVPADENGGPLNLTQVGQYSTMFWIDDDLINKNIQESEETLEMFASQNTNMLISGFRTWKDWTVRSVPTSHLLYREFGLSYWQYNAYFDFVGTHGQNGWPSVQIDPTRGSREWSYIPKLSPRPGAEIIATFDSDMDLAEFEGEPVGLAYETAHGKRIVFGFPLYYLTPESAQALMTKVIEYFGAAESFDKGDLNHSGTIDIADIAMLIDYLFITGLPLPEPALADVDGNPGVSLGDVAFLINYLFLGGPSPVPALP